MDYNHLFHVHTLRCRHAGNEPDEEYVKKAVFLKADSIFFTDHAPFPNDIFGNRMKMAELEEYYDSLCLLQKEYKGILTINIGLEIEYIPEFSDYYKWLIGKYGFALFLGQHICKYNGKYNFESSDKREEYKWMTDSIIEACNQDIFSVLLHPERIYRNCDKWDNEQIESADCLWNIPIPIEYNYSSRKTLPECSKHFWSRKSHNNIVYGLDAHNTKDLEDGVAYFRKIAL